MFDPDPQRPILRLAEPKAESPLSAIERLAAAEAEMEAAVARYLDAHSAWATEFAQAQPISAVRDGNVRF